MTIATIYAYVDDHLSDDEDLERKEEAQAIAKRLRSLYEQGVPFFSKSTFREIVRQLDHCHANPCPPVHKDDSDSDQDRPAISIPAIDGTVVETRLKTGLVMPGDKKNTEFVLYVMSVNLMLMVYQKLT